jgi:Rrf2 family transcriptional regulator, iron-sulfur cluster assembly transcription factor
MKIGTKGRYALSALVDLAVHGKGAPVALCEIAERQDISLFYLEQLFVRLRRASLVNSVRGRCGGYVLAKTADAIAIADVMRAVGESVHPARCDCRGGRDDCLSHDLWEQLGDEMLRYLDSVSLEDVCQRKIRRRIEAGAVAAE